MMGGSPEMAMAGGTGGMPEGGPTLGFQQPGAEGADAGQGGRRRGGATGGQRQRQTGTAAGEQGQGGDERQKMREAMQKALGGRNLQELSPEERQKLMAQFPSGRAGGRGARAGGESGPGGGFFGRGGPQLSDKELESAQLPPPPGEQNQLQVLLRPGLLADIEIIVEKIPNAIHIPTQAVFEKDGKPVVYVRAGERFEERAVKLAKRSESTMVISEGLKPGEEVALSNPMALGSKKQGAGKSGGGTGPASVAPSSPKS